MQKSTSAQKDELRQKGQGHPASSLEQMTLNLQGFNQEVKEIHENYLRISLDQSFGKYVTDALTNYYIPSLLTPILVDCTPQIVTAAELEQEWNRIRSIRTEGQKKYQQIVYETNEYVRSKKVLEQYKERLRSIIVRGENIRFRNDHARHVQQMCVCYLFTYVDGPVLPEKINSFKKSLERFLGIESRRRQNATSKRRVVRKNSDAVAEESKDYVGNQTLNSQDRKYQTPNQKLKKSAQKKSRLTSGHISSDSEDDKDENIIEEEDSLSSVEDVLRSSQEAATYPAPLPPADAPGIPDYPGELPPINREESIQQSEDMDEEDDEDDEQDDFLDCDPSPFSGCLKVKEVPEQPLAFDTNSTNPSVNGIEEHKDSCKLCSGLRTPCYLHSKQPESHFSHFRKGSISSAYSTRDDYPSISCYPSTEQFQVKSKAPSSLILNLENTMDKLPIHRQALNKQRFDSKPIFPEHIELPDLNFNAKGWFDQ